MAVFCVHVSYLDAIILYSMLQFPSLRSLAGLIRAGKFVYDGSQLTMSFPEDEVGVGDSGDTGTLLDATPKPLPDEVCTVVTLGPVREATYEEVLRLNDPLGYEDLYCMMPMAPG